MRKRRYITDIKAEVEIRADERRKFVAALLRQLGKEAPDPMSYDCDHIFGVQWAIDRMEDRARWRT